jgi:hypothetical protein
MHPVIMRQLVADHITEIHAKAEEVRRARRSAPSPGPGSAASWTFSDGDPRLNPGQRPMDEQPATAYHAAGAGICENESSDVRVLLPATGPRGDAAKDCAGSDR